MRRLPLPWLDEDPLAPFPPLSSALREPDGLLAAGGDLSVPRLLNAYRHGAFPWYMAGEPILWWSPDPRCVFATDAMHVPRRLARDLGKLDWHVVANQRFETVIDACAHVGRESGSTWITDEMRDAYVDLHRAGHAHSIEVIDAGSSLVGGLYGVAVGKMFFAESMFSAETNGSKVALLALAARAMDLGAPIVDAQVSSRHLFTLGAQRIPRSDFARALNVLAAENFVWDFEAMPAVSSLARRWPRD